MKQGRARRTLWLSLTALVLCVSLLVGTTYAWFTDTEATGRNILHTGNLDVEMTYSKDYVSWTDVSTTAPIFDDDALWEPGYLEVVYLEIANVGSLALQYDLSITVHREVSGVNKAGEIFNLSDYIDLAYVDDVTDRYTDRADAIAAVAALGTGVAEDNRLIGSLLPGEAKRVAMILYMPTTVGNEANAKDMTVAPSIEFGAALAATQLAYETDSFGPDYDANAGFRYELDYAPTTDGSGLVVVGIGSYADSTVRIPASVSGKSVVGISATAFNDLMNIVKIEIPETVYHIEGGAFRGSDRLQSVEPSSESRYFKTENGVLYSADGTRLVWYPEASGVVTVPNSVTTIASYAFDGRDSLTDVIVPDGLTSVGVGAFDGCTSLRYNRYENGYYLGNDNNPYVALIKLDPSATELKTHTDNRVIADDALADCPNLGTVVFPEGITVIDKWTLAGSPNVTVITVPISVNVIGEAAFADLDKLETVILPGSITEIGDGAFEGCTSLESVTLPGTADLGKDVFKDCDSLTDVTFTTPVTDIPEGTFSGCTSLDNISGLGTLTNVGENAFRGCYELKGDIFLSFDSVVGSNAFDGCDDDLNLFVDSNVTEIPDSWADDWNGSSTVRVHYATGYSHNATHHWYACTESGCGYVSEHIAHTFNYANDYNCTACGRQATIKNQSYGLEIRNGKVVGKGSCIEATVYVNMPIDASAFYGDNTIETVVLSSGVTSIGDNAFGAASDLGKLKHVVFVSGDCSGLTVGDGIFGGNRNSGLTVFVPTGSETAYKSLGASDWQTNVAPLIVGCDPAVLDSLSSMYACTSAGTFKYSGSTITGFASKSQRNPYRDSARDNLVFPTFVNGQIITGIDNDDYANNDYSFSEMKLDTLVIAGGITNMDVILDYCDINTVIIGDCVTGIGYQNFSHCRVGTLILGKNVTSVAGQAFYYANIGAVYYRGTPEDWNNIWISNDYNMNNALKNAPRYYYSETDPNLTVSGYSGNYWHYDANGEIAVWPVA